MLLFKTCTLSLLKQNISYYDRFHLEKYPEISPNILSAVHHYARELYNDYEYSIKISMLCRYIYIYIYIYV